MVVLKRFPDSMTANIAKSILSESGIESFVADENLANADPPVVFASGGLRLMVADEDRERAAEVLKGSEAGLELPDDFDPGEPVEDIPSGRFDLRPERRDNGSGRMASRIGSAIFWLALGALLMWAGLKLGDNRLVVAGDAKYDTDVDGEIDLVYNFLPDGASESKADLNGDGSFDSISRFAGSGARESSEEDRDFDGQFESFGKMQDGIWSIVVDCDGDGRPDFLERHQHGRVERIDWFRKGAVWKRSYFDPFQKVREEIDRDGDGIFETEVQFGDAEEPR